MIETLSREVGKAYHITLANGPITTFGGDYSTSIWTRIWDHQGSHKLLIEGQVTPSNGSVVLHYFNSGHSNTGGIKDHRFRNKSRKKASISELLQQGTLLPCDLLLFAIKALPGIRDLGSQHQEDETPGKHLVKLHIGYTDLSPGIWHHVTQTHILCDWHEEGEVKLQKKLDTCCKLYNRVSVDDEEDETKRDTARFYNQSPFETRISPTPEEQANHTWHQPTTEHTVDSATCFPRPELSTNGLPTHTQALHISCKRSHEEPEAPGNKLHRNNHQPDKHIAETKLVCEETFSKFLLDSVLASLAPPEIEKIPVFSKRVPISTVDPDIADYRAILGDITQDPSQFLPPAEKPPFRDFTTTEQEFFDTNFPKIPLDPERLPFPRNSTGNFTFCPEPDDISSLGSVQGKDQYPGPSRTVPSSEEEDPLSVDGSIHFSDSSSAFSAEIFFGKYRAPFSLLGSDDESLISPRSISSNW